MDPPPVAAAAAATPQRAPERKYFVETAGTGTPAWEINRPQGAVVRLTAEGVFDGKSVLDVGCCIGDNSVHVAAHAKGATVVGCDLVRRQLHTTACTVALACLLPS